MKGATLLTVDIPGTKRTLQAWRIMTGRDEVDKTGFWTVKVEALQ